MFSHPLKYRIACENRFILNLIDIDPEITLMVTSRPIDGFISDDTRQLIGKVKDFQLTDINSLNTPAWHKEDWISPRILN